MGVFLCKMVHYMQSVSAICSVFTLTAMSVERYYAIVYPMRAKYICTISQAKKIIFTTWISSFLLALPILFVQVQMVVGERVKAFWCVRDWEWVTAWRCHELYMLILVLLLPASVMVFTYSSICREIFRVMQRRFQMTTGKVCVNPIVYGFMSKNFRESFTKALCCRRMSSRRWSFTNTRSTSLRI
ncbi:hypothetical protein O3M35_007439 [Rhynocoris fuscipes]|uniref:G-protein coupled receptors family 1 profile domain-containing protein n=1 Tax=Rhynocoris fuscipes TaxID=488301 RepID=A0AAW1DBY4_9HEMI